MFSLISRYNFKTIDQGGRKGTLTWVCSCISAIEETEISSLDPQDAQEISEMDFSNFEFKKKSIRKVKRSNTKPCRFRLRFVFSDLGYYLCPRSNLNHNHPPEKSTSLKVL